MSYHQNFKMSKIEISICSNGILDIMKLVYGLTFDFLSNGPSFEPIVWTVQNSIYEVDLSTLTTLADRPLKLVMHLYGKFCMKVKKSQLC
jgi:hypothetical protein